MNEIYTQWATTWGVPPAAMAHLFHLLDEYTRPKSAEPEESAGLLESEIIGPALIDASEHDVLLLRNNNGAATDEKTGRLIRYGLGHISKRIGDAFKSGDYVGVRSRIIQPQDVGRLFGQFVAREFKRPGWRYNPNDKREAGQMAFHHMINLRGGDSQFATGPGTFDDLNQGALPT